MPTFRLPINLCDEVAHEVRALREKDMIRRWCEENGIKFASETHTIVHVKPVFAPSGDFSGYATRSLERWVEFTIEDETHALQFKLVWL